MAKILTLHSAGEKAERNGNTFTFYFGALLISKAQRQTQRIILRYEHSSSNSNIDIITMLREKKALLLFGVSVVPVPNIRFPTFTYANMGMCWKRNANERWMKLFTCASVDSSFFFFLSLSRSLSTWFLFLPLRFLWLFSHNATTVVHSFYSIWFFSPFHRCCAFLFTSYFLFV